MQINPIPLEGRVAEGANFEVLIQHSDLTNLVAGATQMLSFPIAAKMAARLVRAVVDVLFQNTADATFDDLAFVVGDGGSAARFLASMQVAAKNVAPVMLKAGVDVEYPYTVADTIDIVFTPKAGATLDSLNAGQVRLLFQINDERAVAPSP